MAEEERTLYGGIPTSKSYISPSPIIFQISPASQYENDIIDVTIKGVFKDTTVSYFPTEFQSENLSGGIPDLENATSVKTISLAGSESVNLLGSNASLSVTAWAEDV